MKDFVNISSVLRKSLCNLLNSGMFRCHKLVTVGGFIKQFTLQSDCEGFSKVFYFVVCVVCSRSGLFEESSHPLCICGSTADDFMLNWSMACHGM